MALGALVFGLLCKMYLASKVQAKIKRYQCEIVKSHARILELEVENDQLEKRLQDTGVAFVKDRLVMN